MPWQAALFLMILAAIVYFAWKAFTGSWRFIGDKKNRETLEWIGRQIARLFRRN